MDGSVIMKNILYISYDGMTDPLGQSQVLPYIFGLSKLGYAFHLISFEKADKFDQNREIIQAKCTENNVIWHPLSYTKKPPLLSTIWDVYRMKKLARTLHGQHQFELLHCRSYIAALVGLNFKRKLKIPFLFDMRGFWADERIDGKIWKKESFIFGKVYSYFKKKELSYFQEAGQVISLTENGATEILSWNNLKIKPQITVIPCCVDLALFDPLKIVDGDKIQLKASLGIAEGQIVVGYVGSIGTWYMLPEMLQFFKYYLTQESSAIFLFVTGENPSTILEQATLQGIPSKSIRITSCLHAEVPKHIGIFDFSVFFILSSYSKKASSPTKQGELMAMGIPLVCNAGVGDTDKIVLDNKSGVVLNSFSDDAFDIAIQELKLISANQFQVKTSATFGLFEGVQRYAEVYQKIISPKD